MYSYIHIFYIIYIYMLWATHPNLISGGGGMRAAWRIQIDGSDHNIVLSNLLGSYIASAAHAAHVLFRILDMTTALGFLTVK